MFKPQYRISPFFIHSIEKIAVLVNAIEKLPIRVNLFRQIRKEAANRAVHASTSIEGNQLTLAQVALLNEKHTIHADKQQQKEVSNYSNVYQWIIRHAQIKLTQRHLLFLHAQLMEHLLSKGKCGFYRKNQNYVKNEKNIVVYTPPKPQKVPGLVKNLIEWANQEKQTHAIIVSAIFHHQFVNIHPFSDGNGRLARIVAQWILYQKTFDPYHIFALDEFFANDRKRYYEKIQQARELDYDFTYWIDYVVEGVHDTVENTYERLKKLTAPIKAKITITTRQEEILDCLRIKGRLSSKDLQQLFNINRARVNQLLSPLVKAKIVVREGSARATKYFLRKK